MSHYANNNKSHTDISVNDENRKVMQHGNLTAAHLQPANAVPSSAHHNISSAIPPSSPDNDSTKLPNNVLADNTNLPMQNFDGSDMRDDQGRLVYRSQFLSTHPLRSDCKERVGYGGKKFTYVSGDGVIRTMNAVFGHGGWSSQIIMERMVQCEKDDRGRWIIGYLATVRVTLLNGVSHEDCGSGDGINESKIKAHEKAIKSAITDAMKRAARHFGERLGNALYVKGNGMKTAPSTNKDALRDLDRKNSIYLFGDQALIRASHPQSPQPKVSTSMAEVASHHNKPIVERQNQPLSNQSNTNSSAIPSSSSTTALPKQAAGSNSMAQIVVGPSPVTSSVAPQSRCHVQGLDASIAGSKNFCSSSWSQFPNPTKLILPPPGQVHNPASNAAIPGNNGAQMAGNMKPSISLPSSDTNKRGREMDGKQIMGSNFNLTNIINQNKRPKTNPYSRQSL